MILYMPCKVLFVLMVDKKDDVKIGVQSSALSFGRNLKPMLSTFAALSTGLFSYAGVVSGMGLPYFCCMALISTHFTWQIYTLRVDDVKDAWNKFVSNQWIGFLVGLGFLMDYLSTFL